MLPPAISYFFSSNIYYSWISNASQLDLIRNQLKLVNSTPVLFSDGRWFVMTAVANAFSDSSVLIAASNLTSGVGLYSLLIFIFFSK